MHSEAGKEHEETQVELKRFHQLQTQLNECIRHHQQILGYDIKLTENLPMFPVSCDINIQSFPRQHV